MNHAVLSTPGDTLPPATVGNKTVRLTYVGMVAGLHNYRVTVTGNSVVARPVGDDDRTFGDYHQAFAYYEATVETLTAELSGVDDDALRVLLADPRTVQAEPAIKAAQAQRAEADDADDLAARINAHLDTARAANPDDWCLTHGQRKPCMRCLGGIVPATPTNTGQTVPSGQNRLVRITRTHVFAQPLTGPQQTAIDRHQNGTVRLGNGVTKPMLRAIEDKGYGACVKGGLGRRPYEIELLVLNQAGRKLAGIGDAP